MTVLSGLEGRRATVLHGLPSPRDFLGAGRRIFVTPTRSRS